MSPQLWPLCHVMLLIKDINFDFVLHRFKVFYVKIRIFAYKTLVVCLLLYKRAFFCWLYLTVFFCLWLLFLRCMSTLSSFLDKMLSKSELSHQVFSVLTCVYFLVSCSSLNTRLFCRFSPFRQQCFGYTGFKSLLFIKHVDAWFPCMCMCWCICL